MKKRLLLVRHGETFANIDHVWHGSTDTALTEQGEQQRHLLGANFAHYMAQPDYIVASPLQRARLTAEAIASQHDLNLAFDTDLQEYCIGDWEGYPFSKLTQELDFFTAMNGDEHYRTPGGETRYEVTTRLMNAIRAAWQQDAENIVVVAHSLAFSLAMSQIVTGSSAQWTDYLMDNTAVSEIDLDAGLLVKFNQTTHLDQGYAALDSALVDKLRS